MKMVWPYIRGILLWLDEGVNVLILPFFRWAFKVKIPALGNPHYSVSDVLAEARERGLTIGCIGCKILNYVFRVPDHCKTAMTGMPEDEGQFG